MVGMLGFSVRCSSLEIEPLLGHTAGEGGVAAERGGEGRFESGCWAPPPCHSVGTSWSEGGLGGGGEDGGPTGTDQESSQVG